MRSRRIRRLLIAGLSAVVVTGALTTSVGVSSADAAGLLNPSTDPFYAQPASFAGTTNGQVLDSRPVTITGLGIPLPFTSYQVKYVTEDTHGAPQADVTTVIKPLASSGSPKLLSYQPAIDSDSPTCQTSYLLRQGTDVEATIMALALLRGWTVVTSDYEGPHNEWTAGVEAGRGVLDGIRAAENFTPAGLAGAQTKVGLMGYSGGGQASDFASELAPTYAPELNIVGVAEGGLPANGGNVVKKNDGTAFAGIPLAATVGIDRAYPEAHIDSLLNAKGEQMKHDIASMCIEQFVPSYAFQKISSFTIGGIDPFSVPSVTAVVDQITMGTHGVPNQPLHIYMATNDQLVITPDVDTLVAQYCAEGVSVDYVKYPIAEHISGAVEGAPGALSYLADRFAGKAPKSTC